MAVAKINGNILFVAVSKICAESGMFPLQQKVSRELVKLVEVGAGCSGCKVLQLLQWVQVVIVVPSFKSQEIKFTQIN